MKIYTKKGDNGKSSTINEFNIPKSSKIFDCLGALDELNSSLGIIISISKFEEINLILTRVQRDLFIIGSQISSKHSKIFITKESVTFLEINIDQIENKLNELKNFILPGGAVLASHLHFSRAICRKAERKIVDILDGPESEILKYINRLSDLLFVLSRYANKLDGIEDKMWSK